jgi:bacterial regulatory protein, arsR family
MRPRSEILNYLKGKGYVCAGQIAKDLGIADSTLSGHLTVMKPQDCSSRANLSNIEDLIVPL